jgi:hypothetical protein
LADLPVAVLPLWQEAQLPLTPAWSKLAPAHVVVVWQSSHCCDDTTWLGDFPLAC